MIMERCHLVLEFWQMGIVLRVVNKKPTRCFRQETHLNNYKNYLCTPDQFSSILTLYDDFCIHRCGNQNSTYGMYIKNE